MRSVIPVSTEISGGMPRPGSTSVLNSPSSSPPRTLTAPISVIASVSAPPPVVSRSTTTNVTACSGSSSSSNAACTYTGAVALRTGSTLGRGTDEIAHPDL